MLGGGGGVLRRMSVDSEGQLTDRRLRSWSASRVSPEELIEVRPFRLDLRIWIKDCKTMNCRLRSWPASCASLEVLIDVSMFFRCFTWLVD